MNKVLKSILILSVALMGTLMVSCEKDETLAYNNQTMGNIVEGRFVSDQGNTFNVVEQNCAGKLDTMKRAFILCDVLNKTAGGSANEYDVRLNGMARVLTKDIVAVENATEDQLVQDPVHVQNVWISGGYLNMYIIFPVKTGSTTKHLINLIHEGAIEEAEGASYNFTLTHNSYGDKLAVDGSVATQMGGAYVSFPLTTYIPEETAKIKLNWLWHQVSAGNNLLFETETRSLEGTYQKTGFEHAPSAIATKSLIEII